MFSAKFVHKQEGTFLVRATKRGGDKKIYLRLTVT